MNTVVSRYAHTGWPTVLACESAVSKRIGMRTYLENPKSGMVGNGAMSSEDVDGFQS